MNEQDTSSAALAATRTLEQLHLEADGVRAQLAGLRLVLAEVERDFKSAPGTVLREANQQLVVAAVHSQAIADAALTTLQQLPALVSAPPRKRDGLLRSLRDANEQLVLAAVHFQELEAAATEAHRRQIAFLARVAHELRSPLQPLRFAADLLGRATDEKLLAKMRATVRGQVAHITRLIDDLLDGARVTAGKFSLERSTVDLSHILELAMEACQPALQARHHALSTVMPPQPLLVDADPVRLVQVFGNLLQNAVKYTPEGGKIMFAAAQGDAVAEITVSDNGMGISAEALPHIFELFVQDPDAITVARDGLGIGLAVVRELVEAHGGAVQAYSAGRNQGSRFVVTLPLRTPG